jgi:hypothetical protein
MSLFVKGAIEMSYNASWFKPTLKPNFFNAPGGEFWLIKVSLPLTKDAWNKSVR